jgi:AraC-like DNA-binding protein
MSPFPPRALAVLNDFQVLVYRLFGVHSLIVSPRIPRERNPWDYGRPLPCEWIRKDPRLLARCDKSERSLVAVATRSPSCARCHAGFDHLAVPLRARGQLWGHLIAAPVRAGPEPARAVADRIEAAVGRRGWEGGLEWWIGHLPVFSRERRAAFAGLATVFAREFAAGHVGRQPRRILPYYHLPLRMGDEDVWLSYLWADFNHAPGAMDGKAWFRERAHGLLLYAAHGRLTVHLARRKIEVRKGHLILLPAGTRYRTSTDGTKPFFVLFSSNLDLGHVILRVLNPRGTILVRLRTLVRHAADLDWLVSATCRMEVLNLLLDLKARGEDVQPRGGKPPSTAVDRARAFIEERFRDRFPLQWVARAAGVTVFTLCRRFRAETGTTPMAYVGTLRIREARRLLVEDRLPAKAIAARLGYADLAHFSHAFREAVGMGPRAYRAQAAKGQLPTTSRQ